MKVILGFENNDRFQMIVDFLLKIHLIDEYPILKNAFLEEELYGLTQTMAALLVVDYPPFIVEDVLRRAAFLAWNTYKKKCIAEYRDTLTKMIECGDETARSCLSIAEFRFGLRPFAKWRKLLNQKTRFTTKTPL